MDPTVFLPPYHVPFAWVFSVLTVMAFGQKMMES